MIGLTTARAALSGSETAGSFAIPLDAGVKRIIGKLREGVEVEYGFLGVEQYLGLSDGLHIRVQEGSPAQKAGIHNDDVIVAINGSPVRDFDDLFLTVSTQLAGSEVSVKLAKRPKTVTVNLAKSYVPGKIIASKKPPAVRGFRVDYTSVLLMKNALGLARGHSVVPAGVFVSEVQPGSPAASVRLHENDVITHVDGHQVNTPAEFYQQAAKIDSSVPMELTLVSEEWHKKTVTKLKIPGTTATSSH
jgi:serine protease Do